MSESAPVNSNPDDEASNLPVPSNDSLMPAPVRRYVATFQAFSERCSQRFDALAQYIVPSNPEEAAAPENIARSPIMFGLVTCFLIFGVFGLWASLAPIDSAAIASGKVVLDSNRKKIDHLEGGIVRAIHVREGQIVAEGEALVELDDTAAKARRDLYMGQFVAAQATEARLLAERDNEAAMTIPPNLLALQEDDVKVAANLDAQRRLFESRRDALIGKTDVLGQQIKQSDEEINGLNEQISSASQQLALLEDEIGDVQHLLASGNAPKTRLLALQRRKAEIEGERGERQSMIARSEQRINESKIQMYNLKTEFLNEVVSELKDTQGQLSDLEEQLRAAEDVMRRIIIKAPIAGQVVGLKIFTIGGVVAPREPVMEIVPTDDKLIVEARIKPQDIDVVQPGLLARVQLSAYKTRNVPPIEGEVITVSADRFEDERTQEAYFTARVVVDEAQLAKLKNVELSPGMPAEVLIVTGSRSLISYLVSPIKDSFNHAFREE